MFEEISLPWIGYRFGNQRCFIECCGFPIPDRR